MAINNNTNNKIEEDNIIFAVQGAKSFLKCKMDWGGIGKLHDGDEILMKYSLNYDRDVKDILGE